jgi:hypothetical protein
MTKIEKKGTPPPMYKLIAAKKIRSFCVGTRRLIAHEELLRFVREQSVQFASSVK